MTVENVFSVFVETGNTVSDEADVISSERLFRILWG